MARGQKKSIELQIELVEEQIKKAKEKVTSLEAKKTELENRKKEEAISELYEMIQTSGKSIDEIKAMLITD